MKCLNCPNIFERKFNTKYPKLFCCETCRTRYNARKSYYRNKDKPEYKARVKEYFKRWVSRNREKYNTSVRLANKKRQAKLRDFRKENNLCTYCGKPKELNKSICSGCYSRRKK